MTDREKYLERQRRYNTSEKGAQRRWRYEDSERGQEMRWTYYNWVGWLRRSYGRLDASLARLQEEEAAWEEEEELWKGNPVFENFFEVSKAQDEERRQKAPERERRRNETLASAMYHLRRERMRRGLLTKIGPDSLPSP